MQDRTGALSTFPGRCCAGLLLVVIVFAAGPRPLRAIAEDVDDVIKQMDPLWSGRERPGALQDLIKMGTATLEKDSDNYEVLWRVARAQFWVAHTMGDRFVKKAVAAQAMATAERAVAAGPARVEGHYLYAISVGEYALTIGSVRAFSEGVAGKIESAGLRAYEINRDFDNGAPMAVLGRYYFSLPWPRRDLDRSRRYLEELRVRHPKSFEGRLYLAETYRDLGDEARARAELRYIVKTAAAGDEITAQARAAEKSWFSD
jgi:hypothetical protein